MKEEEKEERKRERKLWFSIIWLGWKGRENYNCPLFSRES